MIFGYIILYTFFINGAYVESKTGTRLPSTELRGVDEVSTTDETDSLKAPVPVITDAIATDLTNFTDNVDQRRTSQTVIPPSPVSPETDIRIDLKPASVITDPMTIPSTPAISAKTAKQQNESFNADGTGRPMLTALPTVPASPNTADDTATPSQAASKRHNGNGGGTTESTNMIEDSVTPALNAEAAPKRNIENTGDTTVWMGGPSSQTMPPWLLVRFANRTVSSVEQTTVQLPTESTTVNITATTTVTNEKKNSNTNIIDEQADNITKIIQKDFYVYCAIFATTITIYVLNIITTFLLIQIKFIRTYVINKYWHEVIRLVKQSESR